MQQQTATNLQYQPDPIFPFLSPFKVVPKQVESGLITPSWWGKPFDKAYTGRVREVVTKFINGTLDGRRNGGLQTMNVNHIFSTKKDGTELWLYKKNESIKVKVCVARKINGFFVGNSSSIRFARRPNSGKIVPIPGGEMKIQEVLSQCMVMMPFQMFKDARLDLESVRVIEKGPDEKLKFEGVRDEVHFTGSLVFKIELRKRSQGVEGYKDQYYLFDLDRNDVKLGNRNFFLSRLSRPVTSLADAYASLKPKEVYEAEAKLGIECARQGEWFFIPVDGDFKYKTQSSTWGGRGRPARVEAVLQSKGNRAHYVEKLSEEGYVKGRVWHGGREHKDIELPGWCKPVPNTAVESYKVSGAID